MNNVVLPPKCVLVCPLLSIPIILVWATTFPHLNFCINPTQSGLSTLLSEVIFAKMNLIMLLLTPVLKHSYTFVIYYCLRKNSKILGESRRPCM